jgi:hypothetical protein
MGQTPRKRYRRKLPAGSSYEKSVRRRPRRSSRIAVSTPCKSEAVSNADHPPAIRRTRYWLRNNTYVDLAVPQEKIGVPFDTPGRVCALTDGEKTRVITELSKCESAIRAGNLHMLELALELCNRCQIHVPGWLLPYVLNAINSFLKFHPRTRQSMMQREIHQLRWAVVHHLHGNQGLTWDAAYKAAGRDLYHTRACASEETIRASYKWMNLHPCIKSMRQKGLAGEIDAFAREQYDDRHLISERLISLEKSYAKPKRRSRQL